VGNTCRITDASASVTHGINELAKEGATGPDEGMGDMGLATGTGGIEVGDTGGVAGGEGGGSTTGGFTGTSGNPATGEAGAVGVGGRGAMGDGGTSPLEAGTSVVVIGRLRTTAGGPQAAISRQ
jgi:hypothetical protein